MKKTTLIVLGLFVLMLMLPQAGMAKDTKKVLKKGEKIVLDPTVYVKEKGKKYHKRNCRLVTGKTGIKLSEAKKKGYEPCKVCFTPETVYVTETGKKYHKKDCKLVKETKTLDMEEAKLKGLEPCKACFPPPPPEKMISSLISTLICYPVVLSPIPPRQCFLFSAAGVA